MALELNEEMQAQLKELCKAEFEKFEENNKSAGKKKWKIVVDKSELALAAFLKNEVELGTAISHASIEDVNAVLTKTFSVSENCSEEIERLKAERKELQEKASALTKRITALSIKAKKSKTTMVVR